MPELPTWLPAHGGITLFAYLTSFFVCGEELADTSGNFLQIIGNFIAWNTCSGIPDWVSFSLFVLLTLPWILVLASFVFSNTVTSAAAVILGSITALIGWLV